MKKITFIALLFVILAFSCSLIYAQNQVQNMEIINSDIRDVLRSFGELGGYNVLMDKTVQGSVSIKFTASESIKDAIEMIARTYGYQFIWPNSKTIIIGSKEIFKDYGVMSSKVYQLNYASAEETVEALQVAVPKERIGKDVRSNAVTVTANQLEHENVAEIIKGLDREIPQVNIEARVEEISNDNEFTAGFKPTIEAGFEHGWFIAATTKLQAYEKEGKSRLIANPNVSTTDNHEGVIMIGQKYPIVTKNVSKDEITYTVTYIDIGTKLKVTPRINTDNVVTVSIKAEISKIGGEVTAGDNTYPKIDTREVSSVVRLREGETFVLSGLIQSEQTNTTEGTPFISKIPVIGWLFKTKTVKPDTKREICIFLTPHIVKNQAKTVSVDISSGKSEEVKAEEPAVVEKSTATDNGNAVAATATATETAPASNDSAGATVQTQQEVQQPADSSDATQPLATQEESPNPPPEPIQVVIDEKSPEQSTTTTTTETTPAKETQDLKASSSSEREIQYTLKKGETIYQVSRKFGVNAKDLLKRNQLSDKDTVKVGQVIVVPISSDHLYQLKPKETLWRIAKRYGTTIEELMELNGLTNATQVKVGQTIILPTVASNVVNSKY